MEYKAKADSIPSVFKDEKDIGWCDFGYKVLDSGFGTT